MIIINKTSNLNDKIEIYGIISPSKEKFNTTTLRTLYGERIQEGSGILINKPNLTIEYALESEYEFLEIAWRDNIKLSIVDNDGKIINGVYIEGDTFNLTPQTTDDGTKIWTGTINFES